ncbi:MAG: hypothetical protein ACRDOO_19730 [Actinomadura sp.]
MSGFGRNSRDMTDVALVCLFGNFPLWQSAPAELAGACDEDQVRAERVCRRPGREARRPRSTITVIVTGTGDARPVISALSDPEDRA